MSYNKKIIHALIVMSFLMLSLIIYLTWFQIVRAPELAVAPENPVVSEAEKRIKRGNIYSADHVTLAYSEYEGASSGESDSEDNGEDKKESKKYSVQIRHYPYENVYAHVIGYCHANYGKTKLESSFNQYLSGTGLPNDIFDFKHVISGEEIAEGADITLTIDHALQQTAYNILGNRKGAIVALDPKTGATLALVAKPDFDPSTDYLTAHMKDLNEGEEKVFYSNATQGLFASGSVFKVITASAAIEDGIADEPYEDIGYEEIESHKIPNSGGYSYGRIDIKKAFSVSSNAYFAHVADKLGYSKMKSATQNFMIGQSIKYDFPIADSSCLNSEGRTNVASVGIGQGDVQVTPLNMALVAAAIANGGTMMQPYLVESADIPESEDMPNEKNVYYHDPQVLSEATSEYTADRVKDLMIECVKSGTGKPAQVSGFTVAGKTGTAETGKEGEDHAWFIAFAPAEDPQIAVCVMVANAGTSGGATCGPLVSQLLSYYLNR